MKRRLLGVVIAILLILLPSAVVAQANPGAGQGLEISPPIRDIKADPGQTITTSIKLRNVTSETLITKSELNDFVSGGEDGQPKILLEDGETSPYTMKEWISTIPSISLKPTEQKPVRITVSVPADASPGGHYGVVRFTGYPANGKKDSVSLSASIGALLLVNVSGDVHESGELDEMFTSQNEHRRWLFEYGPVTLSEKIKNTGNIHFKPMGSVRVTNMFGREVGTYQVNEKNGNVLPNSTRRFDQFVDKKFLIGLYHAQADIVYGDSNKILSRTISFWVIPYKLIIIVLLLLALVIFLIKRYNKYIVKRSSKK